MALIKTTTTQSLFISLILVLMLFALPTVTRASLGGGNASGQLQRALINHGLSPNSTTGK